MREVEHALDPESMAALKEALSDTSGREDTLWSRDVELGEGYVAELKILGSKDAEPWLDVVLFERDGEGGLHELDVVEVLDGELAEIVLPQIGVSLSVVEGPASSPTP